MTIREIKKQAWASLKGKRKTFGLITLANIGITVSAAIVGIFLLEIPGFVVGAPLVLGMTMCSLRVARGQDMRVRNLYDGFGNMLNAILLNFLNSLFVILWSLLLIIPGIYKSYSYSMSMYVLADNPKMSQSEARDESIGLMDGYKLKYFLLQLSFIGWILLSVLSCGVLLFWVVPYMETASAVFYEDIKKPRVRYHSPEHASESTLQGADRISQNREL